MERLRPRDQRKDKEFSGFTTAEVEKMEKLLRESESERQLLSKQFCLKTAQCFNRSTGRAGKPVVKWIQVQSWFQNQLRDNPFLVNSSNDTSKQISVQPETYPPVIVDDNTQRPKGEAIDISDLEFEARSAKDKAWYDVDAFLAHRVVASGEPEARVRFVGFGAEEDEWVNIKADVRIRSVPFEASECYSIRAGDLVLCFQERKDQAIYYDAHVIEIQRRLHDIRGCRCLFLVRYDHDNSEERVRLRRLCCRPLC